MTTGASSLPSLDLIQEAVERQRKLDPVLLMGVSPMAFTNPATWTPEEASFAARELRAMRKAKARTLEPFSIEIEKLKTHKRDLTQVFDVGIDVCVAQLDHYFRANRPERVKYLDFPAGRMSIRKQPDHLDVLDVASAVVWAKQHLPEAVKVDESVLKKPMKKYIESTGEEPDGVELVEGEEKFQFKETE